jgi:transposase InsO family protein
MVRRRNRPRRGRPGRQHRGLIAGRQQPARPPFAGAICRSGTCSPVVGSCERAGEWTTQQARNLIMDLGEQAHWVKFMIRDRGSNYTAAFDAILADAGIRTVLCSVRAPRMNAIAERWIGGCRRELLDRTLILCRPETRSRRWPARFACAAGAVMVG